MIRTGTVTMPAASGEGRPAAFGTGLPRSHHFHAVKRQVPRAPLGLMEIPAVERRPFPVGFAPQMETFTHA